MESIAAYSEAVEFRVLGPLEVVENGQRLDLGGPKQRTVLALLIAAGGSQVPIGSLIEGVYGEEAPDRAHRSIHTFISNLRGVAGELIERRGDGYAFVGSRAQVDALEFEDLVGRAADRRDPGEARELLRGALALWRGHPYADVEAHTLLESEVTQLNGMRVAAIESRVDADLELGRDRELIAELETLTTEYPFNERLRSLQMLALYRAGRQGEALRACEKTRVHLLEMGLDPSPELRDLEQRILGQDTTLILDLRPTVRRASVLVADVANPDELAALLPEERHRLISSQSAALDHAVATHSGEVFAQRGAAVYAWFGEAADAAAAAAEAQMATGRWRPRLRIAIATGDVNETAGEEVSGPPISRAAALVAVGHGGQILLSNDAHTALTSSGSAGVGIRSLGAHTIPGMQAGELVYQLEVDGELLAFPPLRLGGLPPPLPMAERGVLGYELREELGAGPYGVVHRAYQPSIGREVVVKLIRPEFANQADFIRRFEVEAQLVARLEHPHIVPLLDFWREPDGAFLVMRWLRGGSLADRLAGGPLPMDDVDRFVRDLGSALDYAHRRGVAHGSINPSNVLFDDEGNVYLSDFSVGRLVEIGEVSLARDVTELARLVDRCVDDTSQIDDLLAEATAEPGFPSAAAFVAAWVGTIGTKGEAPVRFTPGRNPYKGLRAFGELDAADFYGRADETRQLVDALDEKRLVAVVGPSGIGKSSMVRAGLIAAIRSGALENSDQWLITDMMPGRYPYEELASALLRVASTPSPSVEDELRRDDRGLVRAAKRFLPDGSTLLLVVDQFEELFTLVDDDEERTDFLELLTAAATDQRSNIRIVFTMRADFFDHPLRFGEFGDLLRGATVPIPAPTTESLRSIVEQPARNEGVSFEPGLADRILADVKDQPGALPLLEFSLTELFAQRTADQLSSASYGESGGVLGALGRRAESIYQGLSSVEQAAARHVFLRLVNVEESGRDTRRRARRADLERLGIDRHALDSVLAAFGDHRLLTFDRDPITRGPTVEVAHEAILTEWPALVDWIDNQREDLLLHRRLSVALADWEAAGRRDADLLAGGRLDQHEAWTAHTELSLTTGERELLVASRRVEDEWRASRRRTRRLVMAGFGAAAVVAIVLAIGAMNVNRESQRQESIAEARALSSAARLQIAEDPERALMLAVESIRLEREAGVELREGANALHAALLEDRIVARYAGSSFVALNPAGTMFATGTDGGAVVYDLETGAIVHELIEGDGLDPVYGVFNPDGSRLAVMSWRADGTGAVTIWDVGSETVVESLERGLPYWVDWPGDYLAIGWWDRRVIEIWAGAPMEKIDELPLSSDDVFPGAFDIDVTGQSLLVPHLEERLIYVYSLDESGPPRVVGTSITPEFVALSPDGQWIAIVDPEASRLLVVDAVSGQPRSEADVDRPFALSWTDDGSELILTGNSGFPEVINAASGATRLTLQGQQGIIVSPAAQVAGSQLILTGGDSNNDVVLWDIGSNAAGVRRTLETGFDVVGIVDYVGAGETVFAAGYDEADALLIAADGSVLRAIDGVIYQPNTARATALTGDGRYLAWVDEDGVGLVVDVETGEEVFKAPAGWQVVDVAPDLSVAILATYVPVIGASPTEAQLIDVATRDQIAVFETDTICDGRLSRDLSLAVIRSCSDIEGTRFFDTATGRALENTHYSWGFWQFMPDGHSVLTVTIDGELRLSDLDILRSGASYEEAKIWHVDAHDSFVTAITVNDDGSLVASVARGEPLRVWDGITGEPIAEIPNDVGTVYTGPRAVLHPTQPRILVTGPDGVLREHTLDIDELMKLATDRLTRTMTLTECETFLRSPDCASYVRSETGSS